MSPAGDAAHPAPGPRHGRSSSLRQITALSAGVTGVDPGQRGVQDLQRAHLLGPDGGGGVDGGSVLVHRRDRRPAPGRPAGAVRRHLARPGVARWTMVAYERFAAFYDVVMDDPGPRAARVERRHRPLPARRRRRCSSSAAGPGRSWPGSTPEPQLTGLDRSPEMLAVAAAKVPGAQLRRGRHGRLRPRPAVRRGRLRVRLDQPPPRRGRRGPRCSPASTGTWPTAGCSCFDVNTVGELRRLGEEPPWVYDFEGGTAIIDVTFAARRGRTRRHRLGHPDLRAGHRHPLRAPPRAHRRARPCRSSGCGSSLAGGSSCWRRSTRTAWRPPTPRSRPTTRCAAGTDGRRSGQASGHSRSRRPEARATGRATARRIISSLPTTVTSGFARVTAV